MTFTEQSTSPCTFKTALGSSATLKSATNQPTFLLTCKTSLDNQFSEADIYHKRQLIGSIFPKKFQFEKNNVRTADINPILLKIASINKGLRRNKKRDKSKKDDLSLDVLKAGLEPARSKEHWILSPTCLPIPPLQQLGIF